MWELALTALGQASGPLLKKAAERHVERFFGDQIGALGKLGKRKATVQAMERAWTACVDLIQSPKPRQGLTKPCQAFARQRTPMPYPELAPI